MLLPISEKRHKAVACVIDMLNFISLSIKAREVAEEKEAVEQYGSADSGASLGDILGAALKGQKKD